jgi:hypothetical protein
MYLDSSAIEASLEYALYELLENVAENKIVKRNVRAKHKRYGDYGSRMLKKRFLGRPHYFTKLGTINLVRSFYNAGFVRMVFFFLVIHKKSPLFRFAVLGVLVAKFAVFLCFHTVGVIFLFFHGVVVALLTVCASQCDFSTHLYFLPNFTTLKKAVLPPVSIS